eukprot:m.183466 g.183466  ORF g.183466 m.183466 type:complete len:1224 (-) comp15822_c0_seq1:35-3706(-)
MSTPPVPTIAVDGDADEADAAIQAIAQTLLDAVDSHDRAASAEPIASPDTLSPTALTRQKTPSSSSFDASFGEMGGVAATLPPSMRKVLKEVQNDASIQVSFGDKLNGAFKMVHLGTCEVPKGAMLACESATELEKLVSSLLHKVLLSGTLARKVILVSSMENIGVVDREYQSEVIIKHPTSSIVYHGLKTIKRGKERASFIVVIAKSPYLANDVFHAFEGKSNWSRNKLPYVDETLAEAVRSAYEDTDDMGAESDLTGNGERVDIPSDAHIYRAKYIGSQKLAATNDHWYKAAVMSALLDDERQMKKQTKEKTLQHVVDYAPDVVLVNHKEALRVVGAGNLELVSTAIVPLWVQDVKVLDLKDIYEDEHSIQRLKDKNRRSRSKSPGRRRRVKRAPSKELLQRLSSLDNLTDDQRHLLAERVEDGDLTVDEAVDEAERIHADAKDSVVVIAWRDDTLDSLRCEILIVKNSRRRADKIAVEVTKTVNASKLRADDPFVPTTKKRPPRSDALAQAEISRDDIIAVQMIGSGQFGEVYLANQHIDPSSEITQRGSLAAIHPDQDNELVQRAVKTLRKGAKKRDRTEFCSEAELQLKLSHKNIVQVTGVCMTQEPYLCILEFEPYGDLKKVLSTCQEKGITVTAAEQIFILKQIADAMEYIHAHKFVHMDLATRNALVGEKTCVKVADFGLSRPYDQGRDGYLLKGKMKLPMLWTPPECMPPIVTRGVNEPASGDEIPFYSERTDMWMFGCVIWEVSTYGQQPYENQGPLLEILRKVHAGLRLQCPAGTHQPLVDLMDRTFYSVDDRPVFKDVSMELGQLLVDAGGKRTVRDVGLLLHEGLTKKLTRRSSIVASSMRARQSGVSPKDLATTTHRVLREMSDGMASRLASVAEEEEDDDSGGGGVAMKTRDDAGSNPFAVDHAAEGGTAAGGDSTGGPAADRPPTTDGAAEADATAARPTALERWKKAKTRIQAIIPLLTLQSMTNMAVDDQTGRLKRVVDPRGLEGAQTVEEETFSTNPFDSDDSDIDIDADLERLGQQGPDTAATGSDQVFTFANQTLGRKLSGAPPPVMPRRRRSSTKIRLQEAVARAASSETRLTSVDSTRTVSREMMTTDDDFDFDDDDDGEDAEDDDTDEAIAEDDEILKLMAERRERHRKEEFERQQEIREQYLKEKAEADRVHALELEAYDRVKKAEAEAAQREKDKIYEEATSRLDKELRFSFSFGST